MRTHDGFKEERHESYRCIGLLSCRDVYVHDVIEMRAFQHIYIYIYIYIYIELSTGARSLALALSTEFALLLRPLGAPASPWARAPAVKAPRGICHLVLFIIEQSLYNNIYIIAHQGMPRSALIS